MPLSSPYCYGSQTWTLLKADERGLEAFHMNCQRPILGIRWFHFVTNASVTSQTGEEGLAIRICRRRLSIFGHVRRLLKATPAHSALRLRPAVDARAGGKPAIRPEWKRGCSRSRTTLGSTPTTPGGSHMTASLGGRYDPWPVKRSTDWLTDYLSQDLADICPKQNLIPIPPFSGLLCKKHERDGRITKWTGLTGDCLLRSVEKVNKRRLSIKRPIQGPKTVKDTK